MPTFDYCTSARPRQPDGSDASRECICEQSPVLGRSDDERRITHLETGLSATITMAA
jgi:hypothetical protein